MASAFAGLGKILGSLKDSDHGYVPTTEIYPPLDVEKVAKDLKLVTVAEERAKEELPPSTARDRDDIELDIINRVEEAKHTAHNNLEDQLQLFSQRLSGLDFQGQFSHIEKVNSESLADFNAEVTKGRGTLHTLRNKLLNADKELKRFQEKHDIYRAPRSTRGVGMFFKISILVIIFMIEWIANGVFLSKGSEMGVVGGIVEALFFSFINVGFTLVITLFLIVLITHRNFGMKLIGLLGIAAYVAVAVTINLVLAHYREVTGNLLDGAGMLAWERVRSNPLGLEDINSWLLFGAGLLFSVLTMIDALFMRDPYVGYARVYHQRDEAEQEYNDTQAELIDGLLELRDEHHEKVEAIIAELNLRRKDYNDIIAHRSKLLALFQTYQDQLERTANQLLTRYRNANIKARTSAAPKYFNNSFKLNKIKPPPTNNGELTDKDITDAIKRAQEDLTIQIKAIADACAQGIKEYRELDTLFPEANNG